MSKKPTVSVIVPTYNSGTTIEQCLLSIRSQTYPNIEIIVVDNNSTDTTKLIAKKYTEHVHNKGPERSAQRNYGVQNAKGEYVIIIDSDMQLEVNVVAECVTELGDLSIAGLIIPEESFGEGFWAQCKKLERSFYVGVKWMEAARVFRRDAYTEAGGYDELMVSGEDWDLSQRTEKIGRIGRIQSFILHDEGKLSLKRTLEKKFYYAKMIKAYTTKNKSHESVSNQTNVLMRYRLFFSQPKKLLKDPITGMGMLLMKTSEFAAGFIGMHKYE